MSHLSRGLVVGLLVIATTVVTSGCVIRARARPIVFTTGAEVYATAPMPPPRVEVVTVGVRPGYVWTRGYWNWNGAGWVWIGGHWETQRAGYVWVQPQYQYRGGRHVYIAGGWRAGGHNVIRTNRAPARRVAPPPPARSATPQQPPPPPARGVH